MTNEQKAAWKVELETYNKVLSVVEVYNSAAAIRGYLHSMIEFTEKQVKDNE